MSFADVSAHWGNPALDNDQVMDVSSDRGDVDNGFLRPIPRSLNDDAMSTRSFEDEDMIDLSPHPSPRPSEHVDVSIVDAEQIMYHEDDSAGAQVTQTSATEIDEITFDDADDGGDTSAPQNDHIQDPAPVLPVDEEHLSQPTNGEADEEYHVLIDYDEEDEPAEAHSSHESVSVNQQSWDQNESLDRQQLDAEEGQELAGAQPEEAEVEAEVQAEVPVIEEPHGSEGQNENQAQPGDDHDRSAQHVEKEPADDQQPKYSSHPIVVDFYNQWISLFKGSLPELECFEIDEEVLYGTISFMFEHLRKSPYIEVREWEYLEIHVPAMDLYLREKTEDAEQYSFADLLTTYLDLHSHDGHYAPDPLFVTLTVKPTFRHQLEKLQQVTGNGGGFSKCDFLNTQQPEYNTLDSDSGETLDENEIVPQRQSQEIDLSKHNTDDAAEQNDSHDGTNHTSPTLSGHAASADVATNELQNEAEAANEPLDDSRDHAASYADESQHEQASNADDQEFEHNYEEPSVDQVDEGHDVLDGGDQGLDLGNGQDLEEQADDSNQEFQNEVGGEFEQDLRSAHTDTEPDAATGDQTGFEDNDPGQLDVEGREEFDVESFGESNTADPPNVDADDLDQLEAGGQNGTDTDGHYESHADDQNQLETDGHDIGGEPSGEFDETDGQDDFGINDHREFHADDQEEPDHGEYQSEGQENAEAYIQDKNDPQAQDEITYDEEESEAPADFDEIAHGQDLLEAQNNAPDETTAEPSGQELVEEADYDTAIDRQGIVTGDLNLAQSDIPEGELLIDYSDEEDEVAHQAESGLQPDQPAQPQVAPKQPEVHDDDIITYSDDEDVPEQKTTPTKRARSESEPDSPSKRVKA